MPTAEIKNLPIMRVGTWDASTGRTTILPTDLQSMVAAHQDKLIDRPPLKIGHTDQRFAVGDGEPAYGWVENLRTSDDGNTLLADIAGIPSKLAEILKTAWRNRSAEIKWKVPSAGRTYQAVLSGLALLGVTPPAVKGLDDVMALYSEQVAHLDPCGTNTVFFSDDTPNIQPETSSAVDGVGVTPTPGVEEGAATMPSKDKILEALGLPQDASDADVQAALVAAGVTPETPEPTEETVTEPEAQPETPDTAASAAPIQSVDTAQFAAMQQANASMAAQIQAWQAEKDKDRRDGIVDRAFREGRIHATTVAQYRAALDKDEPSVVAILDALPQIMPVRELGHADFAQSNEPTDEQIRAAAAAYGVRI